MDQITQDIERLVSTVIKEGASDLHLSAGRPPHLRSAGVLLPLVKERALTPEDTLKYAETLMEIGRASCRERV